MRRLHSRILGFGSVCGLPSRPVGEVFLKALPPPSEVDATKFTRFEAEEAEVARVIALDELARRKCVIQALQMMHDAQRCELRQESMAEGVPGDPVSRSPSPFGYVDIEAVEAERHRMAQQEQEWLHPKEPFYDFVHAAAGHKHVVCLTREGNLVAIGCNRYGQVGVPISASASSKPPASLSGTRGMADEDHGVRAGVKQLEELTEATPVYIASDYTAEPLEMGDCATASAAPAPSGATQRLRRFTGSDWAAARGRLDDGGAALGIPSRVACGANFTLVYRAHGQRVIAFGNNHVGQLGVGHKEAVDNSQGFGEWDFSGEWLTSQLPVGSSTPSVSSITCGFNHSFATLSNGMLLAFGSNTWGELGIGTTISPMHPTRVAYFSSRQIMVRKVAAGNSFSLFLTEDGKVYGCGATHCGQLPPNSFDPVIIPLIRAYVQESPHAVAVDAAAGAELPSAESTKAPRQRRGHGDPLHRLIRIRDIACVGDMAVYLSHKNELLVQGMMKDFGFSVPSPRFLIVDQSHVIRYFTAMLERRAQLRQEREVKRQRLTELLTERGVPPDASRPSKPTAPLHAPPVTDSGCDALNASSRLRRPQSPYDIVELVQGPSTLLVRYRNGCVAGLGSNTEGQLYHRLPQPRHQPGREASGIAGVSASSPSLDSIDGEAGDTCRINLAEAHSGPKLLPVLVANPDLCSSCSWATGESDELSVTGPFRSILVPASNFTLVIDHWNEFYTPVNASPVELPPGNSLAKKSPPPIAHRATSAEHHSRGPTGPLPEPITPTLPGDRKADARMASLYKRR